MDVARIDKVTGTVLNIEVVDQEWLDAHAGDPDYAFVPYTPESPASIGLAYDPVAKVYEAPAKAADAKAVQ